MLRNLWFQLHWLLGITAGIVLAIVGVTGAMLSFEHELKEWMNPGIMTVEPQSGGMMSPADLLARVQSANPERRITALSLSADPEDAARVVFAPRPGDTGNRRGETRYLDPYSGELLGQPRGEQFFRLTMQIHRWLAAGDIGKAIVGASTVALIVLSLSGLYLRWPRRALNWRTWLTFDLRRKGRSFLWDLHAVAGTWALLFYLLASLTGLYWSYDWYRNALFTLTGTSRPAQQGGPRQAEPREASQRGAGQESREKAAAKPMDVNAIWSSFQREVPSYSSVTLRLPTNSSQPAQITYLDADPAHERANNRLVIDSRTGAVKEHERYDDKPAGAKLMSSIFVLHSGSFFGLPGLILMMLASLIMPLFAITGWILYLDRRKKKKSVRAARNAAVPSSAGTTASEWLIGFASQTGFAEQLAWQSAGMLRMAGVPVTVQPLSRIGQEQLSRFSNALFVVSTFGEGEPPDQARAFARMMKQSASLSGLSFGLLALGSKQYDTFCGFGRTLDNWLRKHGAMALFERIEVDNGDPGALHNWQSRLGSLTGTKVTAAWNAPAYEQWTLTERHLLNPGSAGDPTFHLILKAPTGSRTSWQAGDLVDIQPRLSDAAVTKLLQQYGLDGNATVQINGQRQTLREALSRSEPPAGHLDTRSVQQFADSLKPLADRQYSVASIPDDGAIHLLLRQARHEGGLGIGSGWLTAYLPVGGKVALRIRSNSAFHLPDGDPPLILIGNGTGLAGLRSHMKARARLHQGRNWLIFGERNAAHDFYFRDEIEQWRQQQLLEQVDLVFSRDQAERMYVQHRLRASADVVRAWIDDGAVILVCGSLEGMAPGVDATLQDILGAQKLEQLVADGRYRRDVY